MPSFDEANAPRFPFMMPSTSVVELAPGLATLNSEGQTTEDGMERIHAIVQPSIVIGAQVDSSNATTIDYVECSTVHICSLQGCFDCCSSYTRRAFDARDRITEQVQAHLTRELLGKSLESSGEGFVNPDGSYSFGSGITRYSSDGKPPKFELSQESINVIREGMRKMWQGWLDNAEKQPDQSGECELGEEEIRHNIIPLHDINDDEIERQFNTKGLQGKLDDLQSLDFREMMIKSGDVRNRTVFSVFFGPPKSRNG